MRVLPVGVPKLMVSTLASGQVRPFVGNRDILMMHSVVDIAGLNLISRLVLANAAGAMVGMVRSNATPGPSNLTPNPSPKRRGEQEGGLDFTPPSLLGKGAGGLGWTPVIAATMFGVTTPCVEAARAILEAAGCEVLVFHAVGSGGQTMEELIRDGHIQGVLDLTTTELADELVGGILTAGPNRLTAAALKGIPQVVSLGALDMVNFGPRDSVPEKFKNRRFHIHNANVTLMRTTPEEMDALGLEIANKVCAARGPTALFLPLKGVSAIDIEGGPFWWPEADAALFQSIHNAISPDVDVIEIDAHINDAAFAEAAAKKLLAMLNVCRGTGF
jgi:uncharacterized protein (UPF0261 family)